MWWAAPLILAQAAAPSALSPADLYNALKPQITFKLDGKTKTHKEKQKWRNDAHKVLQMQQLPCSVDLNKDGVPDIITSTEGMLDAAEQRDPLAMAALGQIFLLGQECAPKRNLTWALHWLDGAVSVRQPDAMALMGFLHLSRAIPRIYNVSLDRDFDPYAGATLLASAAEAGSQYANLVLGSKFADGIGVPESCPTAASHYEKAAISAMSNLADRRILTVEQGPPADADHRVLLSRSMGERERLDAAAGEYLDFCAYAGDATGQVAVGHLLYSGSHGVPCNIAAAERLFESAARRFDPSAHANLGLLKLRRGDPKCVASLRRAAKRSDPSGWAGLGYAYLYGVGVAQSDELAAKALWVAASRGHLDAIYNLGVLMLRGVGGKPGNIATAYRYWSVAAEFSHPLAQLMVGQMALHGLGVRADCRTALFFLRHAAEQGPMLTSLGSAGLSAYEAERPQRALMHYLLAAHAGVAAAQNNAGYIYSELMPKLRSADAHRFRTVGSAYLRLAVLQGSVEAQVQLAALLEEIASDYTRANELYKSAARAGSIDATWHLGYNYLKGRGVPADAKRAWILLREAGLYSKHARLQGVERLAFVIARTLYEARVLITLAAAAALAFSTGGNPGAVLGGRLQGTRVGVEAEWQDDEAMDDFDEIDDE